MHVLRMTRRLWWPAVQSYLDHLSPHQLTNTHTHTHTHTHTQQQKTTPCQSWTPLDHIVICEIVDDVETVYNINDSIYELFKFFLNIW